DESQYEVRNRCFDTTIGGELIEFKGSAEPSDENNNMSKIDMTYFWIFTKRYEVYYLEDDYSTAVVSDSEFEQLWIMSRTPKMQEEKLKKILSLLENKMDLKNLIYTPQDAKGRYK
ncbi:MAG: apolipoprotein D and lipocalin family protein, partial [Sulfurimonas sp.]